MDKIYYGSELAEKLRASMKVEIDQLKAEGKRIPCLAVILVGDNPASQVYVKNKIKACETVGIQSLSFKLPQESSQAEVEQVVNSLANDNSIDGILVQLPLPKHIDEQYILNLIPASKDVDGFLPENIGNLAMGMPTTVACTPFGVIQMLKHINVDLVGKHAVVIGRSNIVGKPMAMLLLNENCTVSVCHSKTKNLSDITNTADIIVCAIGRPKFLKEDMVKQGAIVIDVGINRTEEGLVGDVDFENVSKKASFITPVPGGVGPMTIAMLMQNTYNSAIRREQCKTK